MNLIKKQVVIPENSILRFREYQHNQIVQFVQLGIDYMQSNGFQQYDATTSTLEIIDTNTYENIGHFATKTIKIKLSDKCKDYFVALVIPKLLNGSFFKLNCTQYIPTFFIQDLPIVKKPKSSKLYSLFCPITLFFKDSTAIIYGNNIPISRFLSIYYDKQTIIDLAAEFEFNVINEPMQITLNYFSKLFNCDPNTDAIAARFELLFFDAWTRNLYKECYKLDDVSLKIILDILFLQMQTANEDDLTFIDLRMKRLTYVESLLAPYFRAISDATKSLLKGQQPFKLNLTLGCIIDHFFNGLNKLNLYDITNGYSSILDLKATFQSPASKSELPVSVSMIHESFFGKVCIVTVSNMETGKVVSLVPEQNVDLNYGLFDFSEK